MSKFFLIIIVVVSISACSEKQDTAYSGIRVGVNRENYYKQVDSLVNIDKLAWQEGQVEGRKNKIAYAVQTIREQPFYFYIIPIGSQVIESLIVDVTREKVPLYNLVGLHLIAETDHPDTQLTFVNIDNFVLYQLSEKYGRDYTEDSTSVIVDSGPLIIVENPGPVSAILNTKTWITENYKVEMKHYRCDYTHRIRIVYTPVIKNSNKF
jgi:hypothetical protein